MRKREDTSDVLYGLQLMFKRRHGAQDALRCVNSKSNRVINCIAHIQTECIPI